jgi:hypothetical protein
LLTTPFAHELSCFQNEVKGLQTMARETIIFLKIIELFIRGEGPAWAAKQDDLAKRKSDEITPIKF